MAIIGKMYELLQYVYNCQNLFTLLKIKIRIVELWKYFDADLDHQNSQILQSSACPIQIQKQKKTLAFSAYTIGYWGYRE